MNQIQSIPFFSIFSLWKLTVCDVGGCWTGPTVKANVMPYKPSGTPRHTGAEGRGGGRERTTSPGGASRVASVPPSPVSHLLVRTPGCGGWNIPSRSSQGRSSILLEALSHRVGLLCGKRNSPWAAALLS